MKIRGILLPLLCLATLQVSKAENLLDVYKVALETDLSLSAAKSRAMAGALTQDIAVSDVLPTISFGSSYTEKRNRSTVRPFRKWTEDSGKNDLTVSIPLYSTATKSALNRSESEEKMAALRLRKAEFNTATRVVEAYFGVLAAQDNLSTALSEVDAIETVLNHAQNRFEVGIGTETDVHNAQARSSFSNAVAIQAINDVELAWLDLEEIINFRPEFLDRLDESFEPLPPDPANAEQWIKLALENNHDIAIQHEAVNVARYNIRLTNSDSALFSNLQIQVNDRHGDRPPIEERSNVMLRIGKSFSAAGGESKRKRQATHMHRAEVQQLGVITRAVENGISNTYRNILSLINTINALETAVEASESALNATEEGFGVGTQTSLDVLNAQRDVSQVSRDLQRARYDYLLNMTQLNGLAGILEVEYIQQINAYLK